MQRSLVKDSLKQANSVHFCKIMFYDHGSEPEQQRNEFYFLLYKQKTGKYYQLKFVAAL